MKSARLSNWLPISLACFEAIRTEDGIYVDKTRLIYELARSRGCYFLSRPHLFGKSLLLSTFESLFEHGLEYFKGLAIKSFWEDEKHYKVIRLNFSTLKDFRNIDEFRQCLNAKLYVAFSKLGFNLEPTTYNPSLFLAQLNCWMEEQPDDSFVLLIDEYDAPYTFITRGARTARRCKARAFGVL